MKANTSAFYSREQICISLSNMATLLIDLIESSAYIQAYWMSDTDWTAVPGQRHRRSSFGISLRSVHPLCPGAPHTAEHQIPIHRSDTFSLEPPSTLSVVVTGAKSLVLDLFSKPSSLPNLPRSKKLALRTRSTSDSMASTTHQYWPGVVRK